MVCNRNNFLITHYMASTTIQNCILKNTISCTHVCTTQNSTGHMAGVVVLLFSFVFYSTLHKNGTLFFNVKLSAACNIAMHAYKGGGVEKREISLGMPIRQATAVPSSWTDDSSGPNNHILHCFVHETDMFHLWGTGGNQCQRYTNMHPSVHTTQERKKKIKKQQGRTRQWFIHTLDPGICCPMSWRDVMP